MISCQFGQYQFLFQLALQKKKKTLSFDVDIVVHASSRGQNLFWTHKARPRESTTFWPLWRVLVVDRSTDHTRTHSICELEYHAIKYFTGYFLDHCSNCALACFQRATLWRRKGACHGSIWNIYISKNKWTLKSPKMLEMSTPESNMQAPGKICKTARKRAIPVIVSSQNNIPDSGNTEFTIMHSHIHLC